MSDRDNKDNKTFELDGTRPIENSQIEIADSFEEDGTRPIAESPDFLVRDTQAEANLSPTVSGTLDEDQAVEIDGKRPVDNSGMEVVDTFEADGTRPIMSNKYEVVDTLDIDGQRPITSK